MKKRLLSLVLSFCVALSLTVVPAGASADSARDIDISEIPRREQLKELLGEWDFSFGILGDAYGNSNYQYDCRTVTDVSANEMVGTGGLFEVLVRSPDLEPEGHSVYPGERARSIRSTRAAYSDDYRHDKTRIDWMMRNVFNCSEDDLETLKTRTFQTVDAWYDIPVAIESDGYYYGLAYEIGGDGPEERDFQSAKFDGTYYYISYTTSYLYYGDLDQFGNLHEPKIGTDTHYATLALKEIDGKQYWSIYANSPTEFIYFDTPAQDTPSTPEQPSSGFSDVKESAWYAGDVADIQKYGLINGHPDGTFRPQEKLTLAQAITLAARTHAQLNDKGDIQNGSPWYQPYVDYAAENGLCDPGEFGTDYNSECSRLAMAVLFQRAFPTDTERVLNNITTLPDVEDEGYGSSVFYLYRQGVLTGNDASGTFKPDKRVSRAEAAAILNRVMDKDKRKSFTLEDQVDKTNQTVSE